MGKIDGEEYKIGRFFVENGIITDSQLNGSP